MWPEGEADRDFLTRFGTALDHLGVSATDRMLLAVSGGPDSLALLLIAQAIMPDRIVAATVDHGLRPEAADEAEYVAQICQKLAVPHLTLRPAKPISGNIQSSARAARYALLGAAADAQGCGHIATAHHGDDQLETLLMRLARGSGVNGMAGIRPQNGLVIRPLLGFAKAELEQICTSAELDPVRDPSNDDSDYDRVAMRQWLAGSEPPFELQRAQRTANAMREAGEALDWMTDKLAAKRISKKGSEIELDANDLPADLQRRLVLACIAHIDPVLQPKGDATDRLLRGLYDSKTATIGNILCKGGAVWTFSAAPARRIDG